MNRRWWVAVAAGALVTVAAAFRVPGSLENPLHDLALHALPEKRAAATIIVAIDEPSLKTLGRWPWKRSVLAAIVNRAADAGARGVVLDVLLAEAEPDDPVLAGAMRRLPTIAVSVLQDRGEWLMPVPVLQAVSIAAHGNFELDEDGILRRFASTKQNADRSLPALAVAASTLVTQKPVPVGIAIVPQFRTPPRAIPVVSAAEVIAKPLQARDKIVFIGATAFALSDRVLTPVSHQIPDPGVTIHAAATESLIRGETVHQAPPVVSGVAAALIVATIIDTRKRRRTRIAIAIVAFVLIIAGAFAFFASGIAIPAALLALAVIVSTLAVEIRMLRRSEVSLEDIATTLAEQRARDVESKRVLAHELRTPIASMRGLTQLLAGYSLSDVERKRVATLLEEEAGKLQSMVNGLLDLERLPLRDFASSTSDVNLGDLVARRVEFLQASTSNAITATVTGVHVRADPVLIERVIDNLVGNALKYAPHSPVAVRVRRDGDHAMIEVEDAGPGIPAAERQRVFERFVRGASAAGTAGLGLGLALVGEVARWHHGSVSIDGGANGGALFRVTLPAMVTG